MEIKVGDIVRVTNWGKGYTTNTAWFHENLNELETSWIIRYAYDDEYNYLHHKYDDPNRYAVLYIDEKTERALITPKNIGSSSKVYLIGMDGLELYDQPPIEMTVAEIEKKLGIKNLKIVKEKPDDN